MSDKAAVKASFRKFDIIICTANGTDMNMAEYLSLVKVGGYFVAVAMPEAPWKVPGYALFTNRVHFTCSAIGSHKEIIEMLDFSSKHGVKAWTEVYPLSKANEGIQRVRDNQMKYRVVLEVDQNKQ